MGGGGWGEGGGLETGLAISGWPCALACWGLPLLPCMPSFLPPPRQVHSHWLSETTPPPTLLVSVLGLQTHVWLLEKSPRTGTTMACPQNLAAATGLTGGVKAVSLVPF